MEGLYPLKFTPIYKDKIWGGNKINSVLNKDFGNLPNCGESWELSGVEDNVSVVSNGFLAGNTLEELIEVYMSDLVGEKVFENFGIEFPLLIKFIDANDDLSIQVHPGDEMAAKRHNSFGKTEMWYVMQADLGSKLQSGFNQEVNEDKYLFKLEHNELTDILNFEEVTSGDVFFIPAGMVHAIGKGVVVAEIQQSSDITYRIYDYKRKDDQGNERELHTEQALDVINFEASKNPKTDYKVQLNEIVPLVECEYFTTNMIRFDAPVTRNFGTIDSFVAYMCLEGNMVIESGAEKTVVKKGDTLLIPASLNEIGLIPDGEVTLLEVYVNN